MSKSEVRESMINKLKSQDPESTKSKSAIISKKTLSLISNSNHVFCYVPKDEEVDTTGIIKELLACGVKVYAPFIEGEEMHASRIADLSELKAGKFGLLEPAGKTKHTEFDFMLIPGIAFDENCVRLGRGKGYMDRFLQNCSGKKIGLAFDFQVITSLPRENHDVSMDEVVTEKRLVSREMKKD